MTFLDPIYNFFGMLLAFFYGLVPNLGIAIILLTVAVMLALFPLTAKQAKAMLNMQRAQPEIKRIQNQYKNDKAKQNEEVMKFYQENKINPLAGCLPLVVQMPIFLSLFHVMRNPYQYIPKSSALYAAFCGGANVTEKACSKPPLPHHLEFLGMDLSLSARDVGGGFLNALPYFLLVGLVIATGFMQARQSQRNSPNMNSQMAMVTKVLPIGFGLFSITFPAGLVLYYFVSNLWRLGQQELIMRKITRPGMKELEKQKGGAIDAASKDRGNVSVDDPPAQKRGLRGMFQLPPAGNSTTEPNGADASTGNGNGSKGSTPPKTSSGARSSPGAKPITPGAQRRKTNKRKKKR